MKEEGHSLYRQRSVLYKAASKMC